MKKNIKYKERFYSYENSVKERLWGNLVLGLVYAGIGLVIYGVYKLWHWLF